MISGSEVSSEAPTDRLVAELEETQTALNVGPCVAALREHHTVHNHDMATDTRWPRFAQAAIERGVHSPLSFQLSSARRT